MGIEVAILPPCLRDMVGDNSKDSLDRLVSRIDQWTHDALSALAGDGWESIERGRNLKFAHPDVSSIEQAKKRLRSLGIDPGPCTIGEFKYTDGTSNLKRAFKRMRKRGLVAKEDYYYFPSDSYAAIAEVCEARRRGG